MFLTSWRYSFDEGKEGKSSYNYNIRYLEYLLKRRNQFLVKPSYLVVPILNHFFQATRFLAYGGSYVYVLTDWESFCNDERYLSTTSNDKSAIIKTRRRLSLTHVPAFVVRENALISQPLRDCLQFVVPCLKEKERTSDIMYTTSNSYIALKYRRKMQPLRKPCPERKYRILLIFNLTKSGILTAAGCGPGCPLFSLPDATFFLNSLCFFSTMSFSASVRPKLCGSLHAGAGSGDCKTWWQ